MADIYGPNGYIITIKNLRKQLHVTNAAASDNRYPPCISGSGTGRGSAVEISGNDCEGGSIYIKNAEQQKYVHNKIKLPTKTQ